MWILMILLVGYHDNNSQLTAEFYTKDACMTAAASWHQQIAKAPNYSGSYTSVRSLCAYKGDKPKDAK